MYDFFYFRGEKYDKGSIIQLKQEYQKDFNYSSCLVFKQYDEKNKIYYFNYPYSWGNKYQISASRLNTVTENVIAVYQDTNQDANKYANENSSRIKEDHIEGIVSAWIWYILVMFAALFFKGVGNVITTWLAASFIFFRWRHIKLNGG